MKPHILITEDDSLTANLIRDYFPAAEFETTVVNDGHSALACLMRRPVDFVLLDLMMPGVGGIDVLDYIRADAKLKALPVIIMSNLSSFSEEAQAAVKACTSSFVSKENLNPADLVAEVRSLLASAAAAAPARVPVPVPVPPPLPPRSRRVLVADDDRLVHGVIRHFLSEAGFTVESAHDGRQALEMARLSPPDILVLDGIMPELDGLEVLALWDRESALERIPVIVLTADHDTGVRVSEIRRDGLSHLQKPFSPGKLVSEVKALLAAS